MPSRDFDTKENTYMNSKQGHSFQLTYEEISKADFQHKHLSIKQAYNLYN